MSDGTQLGHDEVRQAIIRQRTSERIIEIMAEVAYESDYDKAMPRMLEIMSHVVHADRLYVLEPQRRLDSRFFEWCAEGVTPRLAALKQISDAALGRFASQFKGRGIIYADTLDKLHLQSELEVAYFQRLGIHSVLVVPLRSHGVSVGAFGADNYTLDEGIDIPYLLETLAPYLATYISGHQLFEELEWSGTHDELTGLLNRHGLDAAIKARLAGCAGEPCVLGLVDIDDFKVTNDLYGHSAGDEALRTLSRALGEAFPTGSILGRNGGDELLVLLSGEAAEAADELFARFSDRDLSFELDGRHVPLSTSIGYVRYPDQAASVEEAFKLADVALYAVKLGGKGRAQGYSEDLGVRYRSQLGFAPRDIADNIPSGILVHRAGETPEILFANSSMVELLGCDNVLDFMAFTGSHAHSYVHPDDAARVQDDIARQVGDGGRGASYFTDYRVLTKDGTVKSVAESGRVAGSDANGLVYYTLCLDLDELLARWGDVS